MNRGHSKNAYNYFEKHLSPTNVMSVPPRIDDASFGSPRGDVKIIEEIVGRQRGRKGEKIDALRLLTPCSDKQYLEFP